MHEKYTIFWTKTKMYKLGNINFLQKFKTHFKFKMRFKVSMINDQGNRHEETVIANNEEEAKRNVLDFIPHSTVLEANWVYK